MSKKVSEIEVKVKGEGQAKSKLGSLASFIKARFVVTLGDIVRIGKSVINFFVEASKKAQEQELVVKKLNQALKNQGLYSKEVSKELQRQASELQKVSTFGDEAITTLQTMLISYGVMPSKLKEVTQATLDLSSGLGMDLNSAGQLVAKTLGSTTNAFARYGIEVDGNVNSTERLASLVDGISKKFGGQAKADTETLSGALAQLNNAWGDLQETIMTTNNDAITPAVNGFTKLINKISEYSHALLAGEDDMESLNTKIKTTSDSIAYLEKQFFKDTKAINLRKEALAGLLLKQKELQEQEQEAKKEQEKKEKEKQKELKLKEEQEQADAYVEMQKKMYDAVNKAQIDASDKRVADAKELSDLLATATEDGGVAIGNALKKQLTGYIDAWMATAIADASMKALITAGTSLGAIPYIIGAGTAGKAAINAVKFAQGGQFETNQPISMNTTSGNQAIAGEKGLERIKVEPVGKPSSQGNQNVNVTVMLGNTELKKIAYDLKPYLNAIDRGVI